MTEEIRAEQKESIKLMKMSKGYQWEIKLLGDPSLSGEAIKTLELLDSNLRNKFERRDEDGNKK